MPITPRITYPGVYVVEVDGMSPAMVIPSATYALMGDCGPGVTAPFVVTTRAELIAHAPDASPLLVDALALSLLNGGEGADILPLAAFDLPSLDAALALAETHYGDATPLTFAIPGMVDTALQARVAQWCADRRTAFVILDGAQEFDPDAYDPRSAVGTSDRAALYQPWLLLPDDAGATRAVPPSGALLGIYAWVERARGIHASPANAMVMGTEGMVRALGNAEQDWLNPLGVNLIRHFAGRGTMVWGARTFAFDREQLYVGVARLVMAVETGIRGYLKAFAFSASTPATWQAIEAGVRNALSALWQDGALMGATADDAFWVSCGLGRTMTADDIEEGTIRLTVGMAVSHPAEFLVMSFAQKVAQ